ncbi:isochorismatase family cysteine hydrolase [Bacillus alkalisoli]|uniref:isochorismatase family cysteine hydrolase n=1 Tax=Bacillus alkalisoli TaxID=2011008 RepID=UPI000C237591|nr:isochorismatase family cysteine hydrolase [Bacillus alkalisoli]
MKKTALLIIDMINDFQFNHGKILADKTIGMLPNILELKKHMNKHKLPIIYVNDHYDLWQADYTKIIDKCTNEISKNVIRSITPDKDDFFLIKPRHSAFYDTPLHTMLLHFNVTDLILTGIAGNICVLFTANDAYMRDFSLTIPKDAIASNSDEDNEFAFTMMENVLKANVSCTKDILNKLSS